MGLLISAETVFLKQKKRGVPMKKIMFMILIAVVGTNAKAIDFEATNPVDPIKFSVTDSNDSSRLYERDSKTNTLRQRVFLGWENHEIRSYVIFNSSGTSMGRQEITSEEGRMIRLFAGSISSSCPLEFTVDRNTGKIIKIKSACDPLANLETGNNRG